VEDQTREKENDATPKYQQERRNSEEFSADEKQANQAQDCAGKIDESELGVSLCQIDRQKNRTKQHEKQGRAPGDIDFVLFVRRHALSHADCEIALPKKMKFGHEEEIDLKTKKEAFDGARDREAEF
jgi:hypothetical protein